MNALNFNLPLDEKLEKLKDDNKFLFKVTDAEKEILEGVINYDWSMENL